MNRTSASLGARLGPAHADELIRTGFSLVPGFLSPSEVATVTEELATIRPTWEQVHADPASHGNGDLRDSFPFVVDSLNDLTVREDLIDWCAGVIGSDNLAMSDALLGSKYGGLKDFDQPLHQDFGNNDLAYPRRDGGFLQVTTILYLTDVGPGDGPTAVVPRDHYQAGLEPFLEPGHPLQEHERAVTVPAGTLLLYDTLTYHRGTSMTDPNASRHVLFVQYADAGHRWIGKHAYGHAGGRPEMNRFMERATPRQREVIGFPSVGESYWTPETRAGVARRYPGMDLTPYAE